MEMEQAEPTSSHLKDLERAGLWSTRNLFRHLANATVTMIAIQFGIPIVPPSAGGCDIFQDINARSGSYTVCIQYFSNREDAALTSGTKLAVSSGLNCCCHLKFCMLVILLSNKSSRVREKQAHFINHTAVGPRKVSNLFHLQS